MYNVYQIELKMHDRLIGSLPLNTEALEAYAKAKFPDGAGRYRSIHWRGPGTRRGKGTLNDGVQARRSGHLHRRVSNQSDARPVCKPPGAHD